MPAIENVGEYEEAWMKWWSSLQPSWRGVNLVRKMVPEDERWENTCKGGNNGFFIIMITLAWWKAANSTSGKWVEMLEDVIWVCEKMIESRQDGGMEKGPAQKR
jgi:hypothetical protein